MGRNNKKKSGKKKQAKPSTSQGGGAIAGHDGGTAPKPKQKGKPAYLASSTEGAPPPPPSLVKAVIKDDVPKVNKVLQKLTVGKGKGKSKSRKKKGGTPIDFNAPVSKWKGGVKAPLLASAAIGGRFGALELLLRIKGIKVNRGSEPHGYTALYAAAAKDRVGCVARLLAEPGILVNTATVDGRTPLFQACQDGSLRSVKLLLADERVLINQATRDDATSNSIDGQWVAGPAGPFAGVTPLRMAAQKGQLEVVRVLVEQDGIDLDKPGNSSKKRGFESPLQMARRKGYDAIVEVLLAAGAKDDAAAAAVEEQEVNDDVTAADEFLQ